MKKKHTQSSVRPGKQKPCPDLSPDQARFIVGLFFEGSFNFLMNFILNNFSYSIFLRKNFFNRNIMGKFSANLLATEKTLKP